MSSCCQPEPEPQPAQEGGCCGGGKRRPDYLFWGSAIAVSAGYLGHLFLAGRPSASPLLATFCHGTFQLMNMMWWGIAAGVVATSLLAKVPREFVVGALGAGGGPRGLLRAAGAGVLLDLCNHGILMVGAKLYERGASLGQVFAFLIASPWNSFSLTLILIALVGLPWTLAFVGLSLVVALATGYLVEWLTRCGRLPENPNRVDLPEGFRFFAEARRRLAATRFTPAFLWGALRDGLSESRMVLRWILFGAVLAALVRALVPDEAFASWFGPTAAGLWLTLLATSVMEVCSEGSSPLAGDLVNRAGAPGNAFTFLMAGAATDYTEIMVLRQTTRSWRATLALPAITVPQVVLLGWLLNSAG